ncbi:hypothetical protein HDV05_002868 [Chytridiales sp. JEL 0842]|nr:hypothetical protein HDV05_002868 [Chytridiales sp. JEL 0842]
MVLASMVGSDEWIEGLTDKTSSTATATTAATTTASSSSAATTKASSASSASASLPEDYHVLTGFEFENSRLEEVEQHFSKMLDLQLEKEDIEVSRVLVSSVGKPVGGVLVATVTEEKDYFSTLLDACSEEHSTLSTPSSISNAFRKANSTFLTAYISLGLRLETEMFVFQASALFILALLQPEVFCKYLTTDTLLKGWWTAMFGESNAQRFAKCLDRVRTAWRGVFLGLTLAGKTGYIIDFLNQLSFINSKYYETYHVLITDLKESIYPAKRPPMPNGNIPKFNAKEILTLAKNFVMLTHNIFTRNCDLLEKCYGEQWSAVAVGRKMFSKTSFMETWACFKWKTSCRKLGFFRQHLECSQNMTVDLDEWAKVFGSRRFKMAVNAVHTPLQTPSELSLLITHSRQAASKESPSPPTSAPQTSAPPTSAALETVPRKSKAKRSSNYSQKKSSHSAKKTKLDSRNGGTVNRSLQLGSQEVASETGGEDCIPVNATPGQAQKPVG